MSKTTDQLRGENDNYRKANPWYIQNVNNSQAACGRFPTLEKAKEAAESYGGCIGVEGNAVLVSSMPLL